MRISVACDVWGIKDNLTLEFTGGAPQTISHLTDRIEAAYQAEVIRLAPPDIDRQSIPRFSVECITLLVDEDRSVWVELFSLKQLFERCQLFVFQPPNSFHTDARGIIPPAREPIIGAGPAMPGRFEPLALPPLDVAVITFHRLDKNREHRVRVAELKAALVMIGFHSPMLPPEVAGRQALDFQAWLHFCHAHPQIAEALVRVGTVDPSAFHTSRPVAARPRFVSPDRHSGLTQASYRNSSSSLVTAEMLQQNTVSSRDMSPRRRQISKTEQQRIAAERLSGGLSTLITARDREEDVAYEAYSHLLSQRSPTRRHHHRSGGQPGRRPATPSTSTRWK